MEFLTPICYKLNGKVFAQIYPYEHDYKITVKCTADAGQFYRMAYLGKVVRVKCYTNVVTVVANKI